MTSASRLAVLLLAAAAAVGARAADPPATDPATGLAIAPGWELVRAHCGACHSYRLVTAQRGEAEFWRDTIRWMQRTQNLWPLPDDQEQAIVDYLASAYASSDWGRRPPLSTQLLPPAESRSEPQR
ncbi:MAG: hypothetical protein RIC56_17475 [Pseudomonadales bacterium]